MSCSGKGTSSSGAGGAGAGGGDAPAGSSGSSGKLHIVVKLTEELLHTYKDINKVRAHDPRGDVFGLFPGGTRTRVLHGGVRVVACGIIWGARH